MFNLILLHLSKKHSTVKEALTAYWHGLERLNASFLFGKKVLAAQTLHLLPLAAALSLGSPCFLEGSVALFGMKERPNGPGQPLKLSEKQRSPSLRAWKVCWRIRFDSWSLRLRAGLDLYWLALCVLQDHKVVLELPVLLLDKFGLSLNLGCTPTARHICTRACWCSSSTENTGLHY